MLPGQVSSSFVTTTTSASFVASPSAVLDDRYVFNRVVFVNNILEFYLDGLDKRKKNWGTTTDESSSSSDDDDNVRGGGGDDDDSLSDITDEDELTGIPQPQLKGKNKNNNNDKASSRRQKEQDPLQTALTMRLVNKTFNDAVSNFTPRFWTSFFQHSIIGRDIRCSPLHRQRIEYTHMLAPIVLKLASQPPTDAAKGLWILVKLFEAAASLNDPNDSSGRPLLIQAPAKSNASDRAPPILPLDIPLAPLTPWTLLTRLCASGQQQLVELMFELAGPQRFDMLRCDGVTQLYNSMSAKPPTSSAACEKKATKQWVVPAMLVPKRRNGVIANDPHVPCKRMSAVHHAVRHGHAGLVSFLLDKHEEIVHRSSREPFLALLRELWVLALDAGHAHVARLLVDRATDGDSEEDKKNLSKMKRAATIFLSDASSAGDAAATKSLRENREHVFDLRAALANKAIGRGDVEMARAMLLAPCADNGFANELLLLEGEEDQQHLVVDKLAFPEKGTAARAAGDYPAVTVAAAVSVELVSLVLEAVERFAGPRAVERAVNSTTGHPEVSALMMAVMHNRMHAVRELLRRGADVSAKCSNGHNALDLAMLIGNESTIRTLLRAGARPTCEKLARSTDSYTFDGLLHLAGASESKNDTPSYAPASLQDMIEKHSRYGVNAVFSGYISTPVKTSLRPSVLRRNAFHNQRNKLAPTGDGERDADVAVRRVVPCEFAGGSAPEYWKWRSGKKEEPPQEDYY